MAMLTPTQQLSRSNFLAIPLQDFTSLTDIDCLQTIEEIDKQLYTKYNLSEGEVAFIHGIRI